MSLSRGPWGSPPAPSQQSLLALSWLNFFLSGMQTARGPIAAAYLAILDVITETVMGVMTAGGHRRCDEGYWLFQSRSTERTEMARTRFAERQILFREGDPADSVLRVLSGTVDVLRELDGYPILLGRVGVGQFVGEMGVVENRPRSATAQAASEVEAEVLTPSEFLDEIVSSPQTARELIRRLSQRLRQADDRIVNDERRSGPPHGNWQRHEELTGAPSTAYLTAKNPWLQRQLHIPVGLGALPFVIGRRPLAGEGLPSLQPDLMLDDTAPFRLSRNHFLIERRDEGYHVRDLGSTLGTMVNGEPIGHYFRTDDASLGAGENEVIAGGMDSSFVFSVFIA